MTAGRAWYRLGLALMAIVIWGAHASETRAGKLIGVVFDDSGSMRPSFHLPLLGLQMLASTLDGRQGQDRLLITRFGWHERTIQERRGRSLGPNILEVALAPQSELQATIDDFRDWRLSTSTNTPYQPLDIMLDTVAREAQPGQEVHFVVISDGAFNPGLPSHGQMRSRFGELRDRLTQKGARLQAHFLLIVNTEGVAEQVRQQGVRAELLRAFNGADDAGSYVVDSFPALREAMIDIIARISGTDPRRSSSVAIRSGSDVTLNLPFAVSRVIALSVGPHGGGRPVPRGIRDPVGNTAVASTRVDGRGEMLSADSLPAWRAEGRWAFAATQFIPTPFLQPGRHVIPFDGPVSDDVVMLFRTDVAVGWRLLDGDGELRSPATGQAIVVPAERDVTLDVFVRDKLNGDRIVNMAEMPADAEFEALIIEPSGRRRAIRLQLDLDNARVRGLVRFTEPGPTRIQVEMRAAGAPSVSSGLAEIEVAARADFSIRVEPSTGGPGNRFGVEVLAGPPVGDPKVATVAVTLDRGPGSGIALIAFSNLPVGIEAVHDGTPLPTDGKPIPYRLGQPIDVQLRRTNSWTGHVDGRPLSGRIVVSVSSQQRTGQPRARGSLEATIDIGVRIPPVRLVNRGHAGDRSGQTPLPVAIGEFGDDSRRLDLAITGALTPPTPDDVSATFNSRLASLLGTRVITGPAQADGTVPTHVILSHSWCLACLLYWNQGRYDVLVSYRPSHGRQNAAETVAFVINDNGDVGRSACSILYIVLAVLIYVGIAMLFWLTAYTFPARSTLAVETPRDFEPVFSTLAGTNFALGAALLWPLRLARGRSNLRIREERRREGLRMIAEPGGMSILPTDRSWPNLTYEPIGTPLAEASPIIDGQQINPIRVVWATQLIDYTGRRVLSIWQRRSEAEPQFTRLFRQ
jgi:hypothetical protein